MELFENYDRRIAGIEKVMQEYGIKDLEESESCVRTKALIRTRSRRAFSRSALRTQAGPMCWARPSPSKAL